MLLDAFLAPDSVSVAVVVSPRRLGLYRCGLVVEATPIALDLPPQTSSTTPIDILAKLPLPAVVGITDLCS